MRNYILFLIMFTINNILYADQIDIEIEQAALELNIEYETLKLIVDEYNNNSTGNIWVSNDENKRYTLIFNDDNSFTFTIFEADGNIFQNDLYGIFIIEDYNITLYFTDEDGIPYWKNKLRILKNLLIIVSEDNEIIIYIRQ